MAWNILCGGYGSGCIRAADIPYKKRICFGCRQLLYQCLTLLYSLFFHIITESLLIRHIKGELNSERKHRQRFSLYTGTDVQYAGGLKGTEQTLNSDIAQNAMVIMNIAATIYLHTNMFTNRRGVLTYE